MSPVNSTNMILNNRLRGLETTLRSAQKSLSVSERMSALAILAIPTRPCSEGLLPVNPDFRCISSLKSGHWLSWWQGRLCLRCVNSCTVRRKSVVRHFHLGNSTNTVAANYGSGYALEVMREHMEQVW